MQSWHTLDDALIQNTANASLQEGISVRDATRDANLLNIFDTDAVRKLRHNHQTLTHDKRRPQSRAAPSSRCLTEWSLGWKRTANACRHAEAAAALTVALDASCDYSKPSAPHPDVAARADANTDADADADADADTRASVVEGTGIDDDAGANLTSSGSSSILPLSQEVDLVWMSG